MRRGLEVVPKEKAEHHRYAVRDLDVLGGEGEPEERYTGGRPVGTHRA
ncbi:MAG: hypothetical protein ACYDEN_01355 [Acidimicrobiales bacterium]